MDDRTRERCGVVNAVHREPYKVAIIGSGPGAMFMAWHLAAKAGPSCQITVSEASDRLGGKIQTGKFAGFGPYEAGAPEICPLHDLIVKDLGLQSKYLHGGPCVLDGKIIFDLDDLAHTFGQCRRDEVKSFRERAAGWLSPRRYIRTMAHSDVAAAPHQTNGVNFLKNVLMDVDGYLNVFSIVGGNEQIVARLPNELQRRDPPQCECDGGRALADDPERLGEAWEKTEAPRARLGQWYEDPESLLCCVYERASTPGPSSLDEAAAEENPAEDQEEYDDVALIEAW